MDYLCLDYQLPRSCSDIINDVQIWITDWTKSKLKLSSLPREICSDAAFIFSLQKVQTAKAKIEVEIAEVI